MPILPSSPSDFTATIKSAAVANAAVGGVSTRPSKNSGGYVSLGALGAIVTQSIVARATISQRFDPDLASAPASAPAPAPVIQTITLNRTGTQEAYVVKYNTNGSIQWARRINGQGDGVTSLSVGPKQGITTDATGNVYVIGTAAEAVTIFDVDNTTSALTLPNATSGHSFIIKYSTLGVPLWARRISGVQGNSIAVDPSGNVYAAGCFNSQGVSVFAANNTTVVFTSGSTGTGIDGYVVKYNSDGTPVWLRRTAGVDTDSAHNIAVDSSGNVFICGYTTTNLSLFDGNNNSSITVTRVGSIADGFLVKYNTNGDPQWGRSLHGRDAGATAVAVDSSGNAYVIGYYPNATVFTATGGSTSQTLPSQGIDNSFLVKYDTTGEPLWARLIAATNAMRFGITLDTSNNVYITGFYNGTMSIRNVDDSSFVSHTSTGRDCGIIKYNTDGVPRWFRRIGGAGDDRGTSVGNDSTGNIYVSGIFTQAIVVFNGNGTTTGTTTFASLANSGNTDSFLVKYDTNGTPIWATRIDGTGSDIANRITVDASGNPHVIGSYTSDTLTLRTTGF